MRFQTIKEIDEVVFQEIKQEGPLGFDKYRNFILQQADDAEKQGAKYKQLALTVSSPTHAKSQSSSQVIQTVSKATQSRVNQQLNAKQKPIQIQKPVLASAEQMASVQQLLRQMYNTVGNEDLYQGLSSFISERSQEQTLDFQGTAEFLKPEFENYLADNMLFVELDQREMHSDLLSQKGLSVRQNIGFLVEKKTQAHQLTEQFFKTLTAQKQSKFIKEFKEMRA